MTAAPQLSWRKPDDWTLASSCGRYQIKRYLNHDRHPATDYDYTPQRCDNTEFVICAGKYADSILARQACEDDLTQQQAAASVTEGVSK